MEEEIKNSPETEEEYTEPVEETPEVPEENIAGAPAADADGTETGTVTEPAEEIETDAVIEPATEDEATVTEVIAEPVETPKKKKKKIKHPDFRKGFRAVGNFFRKAFSKENRRKLFFALGALAAVIALILIISAYNGPKSVARRYMLAELRGDYERVCELSAYNWKAKLIDGYDKKAGEAAYFEYASDYYDEDISSWRSFFRAAEDARCDYLDDEYGRCKVTARVTRTKDVSLKKLGETLTLSDYADYDLSPADIRAAKMLTVKYRIEGLDGNMHDKSYVWLVRANHGWKVLQTTATPDNK